MHEPKKRWWRKKRWAAAFALWLLVLYPLSVGPAGYAEQRGWLPTKPLSLFYAPVIVAAAAVEPRGGLYSAYLSWWGDLSRRQAEAARRQSGQAAVWKAAPAPPAMPAAESE